MAVVVEAAVPPIVVHPLEEGRPIPRFEAIADEQLSEFLEIVLNLLPRYLILGALWVDFQQAAASEVSKVVLKLVLLGLDLKQGAFSGIVTHYAFHPFYIRLYSAGLAFFAVIYKGGGYYYS